MTAMTNENKTMVVDALEQTFQREAFCSTLKLVSPGKNFMKITSAYLEYFLEAAYIKWLGLMGKVGVVGAKPRATPCMPVCVRHLCYFSKSSVQLTVLGKPREVSGARKLSALSRSCSTAMLRQHRVSQLLSICCPQRRLSENSPRGGVVAVEPNAALGKTHLPITLFFGSSLGC